MSLDYNATVTSRVDLAPETMVIRVKLEGGPIAFQPGQYTVLGLKKSTSRIADAGPEPKELQDKPHDHLIRRAYSITSQSSDTELEFVVTLVRTGALTPRLFNLREGGRLYVDTKPAGAFTLQKASGNRDLLLIATGSALAPYLSMLRSQLPADNPEHQVVVVHAAAVSWDLAFRPQLEVLSEQSKHFTYLPTITDPERDKHWQGLIGPVEQLINAGEIEDALGITLEPDHFDVFLAGQPDMIDAVTALLEARGFTSGSPDDPSTNIHSERYW